MGENQDTRLRCFGCRSFAVDYSDMNENGMAFCEDCRTVFDAEKLLHIGRDHPGEYFMEELTMAAAPFRTGGNNEVQELIFEASEAARRGDTDMAMHVLRCAAEPKWSSVAECQDAYNKAMGRVA